MKKFLGAFVLIMSLVLVACGGAPKEPTSPPSPKATNTPVPVQPTAEAKEYDFAQAANLSALKSYRVHYTLKWETTKEGKKESGSWEVVEEVTRQPAARHVVWSSTDAEGIDTFEFIQIGQDMYMKTESGWMAMYSASNVFEDNPWVSDPFGMISGNRGKLVQRNVVVNGVPTDHYVFDESTLGMGLGLGAISKAQGEVWVSNEFKVAVKYVVHYEGKELAIGGGEEGSVDSTFDLTDMNKPITIEAPTGVASAMPKDIPILDDAMELTAVSGMLSYKTNKDVPTATAFYEVQMPAQGWAKGESAIPGFMSFTKGSRTAQIMIQSEEGKTTVMVMISGE